MDFCLLLCCFDVQSDTLSYSFWTSACFPTALTSNPPRFLAPFGLLPCLPQLQRPIRHGFLLLLDLSLFPRSFNVQSVTLSCSFWTSAMPPAASTSNLPGFTLPLWTSACFPAALTSNPPRFLAPFGLLPCLPQLQRPIRHAFLLFWTSTCLPQLQRPIRHAFLLLLDFCLLPHSFNVQSTTVSCSFWTSAMPPTALTSNPSRFLAPFGLLHMPPTALTSNPSRFLAPFGLLPCLPQPQRPIHHAFLLLLDLCLLSRRFNVQSDTHPIHTYLPTTTSSSQRKKATPAHQCQHCFISFNSLLIQLFNLITIPLFFSFP